MSSMMSLSEPPLIDSKGYKPMYEREKQRAMTPEGLTSQIDAVASVVSQPIVGR